MIPNKKASQWLTTNYEGEAIPEETARLNAIFAASVHKADTLWGKIYGSTDALDTHILPEQPW